MKHLFCGSALFVALFAAVPAVAADIPVKAPIYKAPVSRVAYTNWSGFYVGGHAGAGWMGSGSNSFADPGNTAFDACTPCLTGFSANLADSHLTSALGGVHAGWNWQVSPSWLVGVETDFTFTRFSDQQSSPLFFTSGGTPTVVAGSNVQLTTDIRWLASIRGRIGLTWDTWLAYVTGGAAWANVQREGLMSCGPLDCFGVSASGAALDTRFGGVVGGGVEWQPSGIPWRARLEYLYYRFNGGDDLFGLTAINVVGSGAGELATCGPANVPAICPVNWTSGAFHIHTLRAGLSYSFGSDQAGGLLANAAFYKGQFAPSAYNWTGFYIGGNAGFAWGQADVNSTQFNPGTAPVDLAATVAATSPSLHPNGFVGGGQAGYNLQAGNFVYGGEVDFGYLGLKGLEAGTFPFPSTLAAPFILSFRTYTSVSTDWLMTARGRLGWAADNWLFYGTGGLAVAREKFSQTLNLLEGAVVTSSFSNTKAGWVIGGGVEYALYNNWSVKGEYLYADFGTVATTGTLTPPVAGAATTNEVHLKANIARLGINYKFGNWGKGPVVASY